MSDADIDKMTRETLVALATNIDHKTAAAEKELADLEVLEKSLLADQKIIRARIEALEKR